MRRNIALCVSCLLLFAALSAADIIVLKNGNRLEVSNAEVKGDLVTFRVFGGRMSIEATAVERIEKTSAPASSSAGIRNAMSGTPYRGTAGAAGQSPGLEGGEGPSDDEATEELVNFYINQKTQLLKELQLYETQIQTLRSVIYAKSAIFESTEAERQQISELENLKKETQSKLQALLQEVRRSSLNPGDVRRIESAGSSAQTAGAGNALGAGTDPGNADTTWIDVRENATRNSPTELTEEDSVRDSRAVEQRRDEGRER